jgi:ribosomal protein S18 acetylase RimI-like enzyme
VTAIRFSEDAADDLEISRHLALCNSSFVPPLRDRVEITSYADKIVAYARRFEAWQDEKLVGLVAAYCNSPDRDTAYITNVSVLPEAQGVGIGAHLIQKCIAEVRERGFERAQLEVGAGNVRALKLYRSLGFQILSVKDETVDMALTLNGTRT